MRLTLAALVATLPLLAVAAPTGKATLHDGQGKAVGTATLSQTQGGVKVDVTVTGLAPGMHAIHVHTVGRCEAPDFASAGGHFNPGAKEHGLQNPKGAHVGDMPNLVVAQSGEATASFVLLGATLVGGGPGSLFQVGGTAVVLHAVADDMKTDPAGNAGARIACGVIER